MRPLKQIRGSLFLLVLFLILNGAAFAASNEVQLTPKEMEFIQEHPVIHMGVDPAFIPYEFIDSDGVYKGIAADYCKLISERLGIELVVEKNLTWPQAYEKGAQKQLDVLPCVSKTKEREQYFLFSEPYYTFQRVVFINENNNTIQTFDDLLHEKVAVQTNSSHHGFLKGFDSIELNLYSSVDEALLAVSNGKELAFVGNLATSSYLLKSNGIANLKYIEIESEEKQSLYFAVRNDYPLLIGILNKALKSITKEEKITINNRWVSVQGKIDYREIIRIIGITGVVIALVVVVSFFWIVKLRREIAVRKKIQEELKAAKEEAELANRIKSTFLARMSHEIRTPLNAITGMTYLVKKTEVTATQKKYLDKITQASRNMLSIINDILDFSKIEAGRIEIEKVSFNLDKVLQQVINIIFFKVEEQGIDFSMNKDPDVPTFLLGDPTRMEQILLNVVNNAVKFTNEGAVSLSVVLVAKQDNIYTLEFRIKDTGIGMTGEQKNQLFQPFNQGDSSISRRFGGTGLGLSIVKSLVDRMGGSIQVESVLGEGSTFSILLSLEADQTNEYEAHKKSAFAYFQNIRVLVLQKNSASSNLLHSYLTSFHLDTEFAASEDQALQLFHRAEEENKPYHLFILDDESTKEGGFEFINKLKVIVRTMPKCILMVPLMREELLEKLDAQEIDFGITKPILPSVLYNGIVEIFKINLIEMHDNPVLEPKQAALTVQHPYHVLIVEDNKTNQFIAQSILEQSGFVVSLADNGQEGVDFFAANQKTLDLILMDLHMPVLNGLDATSLIRRMDQSIPIIAMTADAITGVEEMCKSVGINHYISKPFEPDQFVGTILQVIEPSSSRAQQEEEARKKAKIAGVSVLDESDGLRRIGNNAALYAMVLDEYYKENKEIPALLREKIEKQAYDEAVKIVHKIKSSSGNIGAKSLHENASLLQKALSDKDEALIIQLHQQFQELLVALLAELETKIHKA